MEEFDSLVLELHLSLLEPFDTDPNDGIEGNEEDHECESRKHGCPQQVGEEVEGEANEERSAPECGQVGTNVHQLLQIHTHQVHDPTNRRLYK